LFGSEEEGRVVDDEAVVSDTDGIFNEEESDGDAAGDNILDMLAPSSDNEDSDGMGIPAGADDGDDDSSLADDTGSNDEPDPEPAFPTLLPGPPWTFYCSIGEPVPTVAMRSLGPAAPHIARLTRALRDQVEPIPGRVDDLSIVAQHLMAHSSAGTAAIADWSGTIVILLSDWSRRVAAIERDIAVLDGLAQRRPLP
jgi:hypothetical protein